MTAKQEKLFNYYYNLMSKEYREEILSYEDFDTRNLGCSIKVNFKSGDWIRVYQKMDGQVEWY